jgi:uroporphyrinogen decarboxylase
MGDLFVGIWRRFLAAYGDTYAVCRFGDDLGFKSSTLLPPDEIRTHLIPQYARVIAIVHEAGKPFLLHSCGNIFEIMEDLIETAGIDAKHSNEDIIAPFTTWVERYGDRIGNFGGIDTDVLCTFDEADIRRYVTDVYGAAVGNGGIALGSGNSIPDYTPPAGYQTMLETVRELRDDKRP